MLAQIDTKTVYSFMESRVTIEEYVRRAKSLGYTHLGIMDRDNLYAAYGFMEACWRQGLQPIVGCELVFEVQEREITTKIIALDITGYRHLMKLSTAHMMGQRDLTLLKEKAAGLLVIVPMDQLEDEVELGVDYLVGVFPDSPAVSGKRTFPLYEVRYFEENQRESLQVLRAIKDNVSLHQVPIVPESHIFLPAEELESLFLPTHAAALETAQTLLADVSYQLDYQLKLPRFNRARPAVEELRERSFAGLAERGLTDQVYQERLEEELAVIHEMGFDDYFLIVWDLLRFGRSKGYYMGMGRGSAVGSLVAYALQITGIDPVKHQLLFERFLNQERYSMPDIDIDIPDVYRPEFIRYVRDRYGSYHSAQIVTYSTFGAKQAIRDVFKRFGTPEYELTSLTRRISFRDTLASAYERNASFRQLIQSKPEYQKAFAIAQQIEGQPRQTSVHAAGVVMSDEDLTDTIPLKPGDEMLLTQYDAHAVEANGLLKMDFLGLRNLTFVQRMKEKLLDQEGIDLEIAQIDLEDKETLALFAAGKTKGIFQFEQAGAIQLLKRVKPTSFEEVVATTSLNRPGASDYATNFVKRKVGQEASDLLDDSIAPILSPTYGIMLYQEQVMQIAQVYAGFTLGKADLLRRAMSKKNAAEMQSMEADFLEGAARKGHDQEQALKIFAMMAKFAGYGFNRSHAYAYAALAFQLAYFKTHYPAIFFEVMLNYSSSDYVTDALQCGFRVAPMSLQTVPYQDKCADGTLYLGLKHIKGLPREMAYWLIEERKKQPFTSVEDVVLRLPQQFHKKELLQPLVEIGVFDTLEPNRKKILANLDNLFVYAETFGSFFAAEEYDWTEVEDYSDIEKFEMEQAIVGIGLSPHPLLAVQKNASKPYQFIADLAVGSRATILVQVMEMRLIRTKKTGQQMAFVQVTDTYQKLDVTVFPESYQRFEQELQKGAFLYITGKVSEREGQVQLVLEQVFPVEQGKCWILLENHEQDTAVARILQEFQGGYPVILHYQDSNETVQLTSYCVKQSDELIARLADVSVKTVFR